MIACLYVFLCVSESGKAQINLKNRPISIHPIKPPTSFNMFFFSNPLRSILCSGVLTACEHKLVQTDCGCWLLI